MFWYMDVLYFALLIYMEYIHDIILFTSQNHTLLCIYFNINYVRLIVELHHMFCVVRGMAGSIV